MTIDLDRLAELEAKAKTSHEFQDFWTETSGLRIRFTKESEAYYVVTIYEATPGMAPIAQVRIANYRARDLAQVFPQSEAGVAMRNALPSLITELKAARAVVEAARKIEDGHDWAGHLQNMLAYYDASIAAYQAVLKEGPPSYPAVSDWKQARYRRVGDCLELITVEGEAVQKEVLSPREWAVK